MARNVESSASILSSQGETAERGKRARDRVTTSLRPVISGVSKAYYYLLNSGEVGMAADTRWLKSRTVRRIVTGVDSIFDNNVPQEVQLTPRPLFAGSDIHVTKIALDSSIQPGDRTVSQKVIRTTLEHEGKVIELAVGKTKNEDDRDYRGFVSYKDVTTDSSQPTYYPDRNALAGPFINYKHQWRDITVGALEETVVAIVVDTAVRAVFGKDKGFSNLEEQISSFIDLYEALDKFRRVPPIQSHDARDRIGSLFAPVIDFISSSPDSPLAHLQIKTATHAE